VVFGNNQALEQGWLLSNKDTAGEALVGQDNIGNTPMHYSFGGFANSNTLMQQLFKKGDANFDSLSGLPDRCTMLLPYMDHNNEVCSHD
jgi:hypothetical protein